MKNVQLYLVVFISGAAVLAVEILGTRILGPFYGVSLFLWSALITVTLAALSAGYWLGGRWADRGATLARLCQLPGLAGAWLLAVPWLKHPILAFTESLGLRLAVLVSAFILFAPPLTLLGMVSPYAIKLKTLNLTEVGRTAGNLYAMSTIASVLSALLTGFLLIPNVGVNRLTFIIGLILLLAAALGMFEKMGSRARTGAAVVFLGGVLALWFAPASRSTPARGLVALTQSAYAEIRVLDTSEGRHLLIDGGIHTIVDTLMLRSIFPYVAVVDLAQNLFARPGEMLLIGLGGGSVANNFSRTGWRVAAVEIDPVITRIAQGYFDFDSAAVPVHHMDGRRFLAIEKQQYDLIVLDAFGSSAIPFHLVTAEAFALMAARLRENGILVINIETVGWHHVLTRALAATLRRHFSEVLALPLAEPPDRLGNIVLFAANRELELKRELERDYFDQDYRFGANYHRVHAWDNRFSPDTRRAPVLTDDLNPVEVWSEAVNFAARKELHEYFEKSGLSW
jgi:spermidine synthase